MRTPQMLTKGKVQASVRGNVLTLRIPLEENDTDCKLFNQPNWPGWLGEDVKYKGRRLRFTGTVVRHPNKYAPKQR